MVHRGCQNHWGDTRIMGVSSCFGFTWEGTLVVFFKGEKMNPKRVGEREKPTAEQWSSWTAHLVTKATNNTVLLHLRFWRRTNSLFVSCPFTTFCVFFIKNKNKNKPVVFGQGDGCLLSRQEPGCFGSAYGRYWNLALGPRQHPGEIPALVLVVPSSWLLVLG